MSQSTRLLTRRNVLQSTVAAPALAVRSPAQTAGAMPTFWVSLLGADARSDGRTLTVTTGAISRSWRWAAKGLRTLSIGLRGAAEPIASAPEGTEADWSYPGLLDDATPAILRSLTARAVRFDPLTSDRLEVVAEVEHAEAKLLVRYVIWAYPDAPGLRTQIHVRGLPGFCAGAAAATGHAVDSVPAPAGEPGAAGYFNHTQGRNRRETPILQEGRAAAPVDWANLTWVGADRGGICVVKESHKCVNQTGVDTGAFELDGGVIRNTGWGPSPEDFLEERFRECWASWTIAYRGGATEREWAVKRFDRARFPVDSKRDIYVMANTWGSGAAKPESLAAASEENILRQIASAADLGIEVQQIDDGWQGDNQYEQWLVWPERYPEGWKNVRAAARKSDVDLGLWAAWNIGPEALRQTYDEGGFRYYKIDFARLDTYAKLEDLMSKMRGLVEHSGHTVRVNWDVTENPPRVGYYYARDLGNIYLENRKPQQPEQVVYHPYLVLRDAWHVAKYTNLNRFQVTVQNPERVNREVSDAYKHPHDYTVAIALMGSPIFFQETHYYDEAARRKIRPLLATYKLHRREMYRGYVYPIGATPDNASWTGFQNIAADRKSGYLMVFREIGARSKDGSLALALAGAGRLRLTNLMDGRSRTVRAGSDGAVSFRIAEAPGFLFLRYELV